MPSQQGPRSDPQRGARSTRRLAIAIGIAVVAVGGRAWVKHQRRAAEESVRNVELVSGRRAPAMRLVGADQSSRRLDESRGRPVLLHFWASWCPPCRRELPSLLALGQRLAGDIELVALTVDDDWAPVRDFFGGEVPSNVLMDASDSASAAWQLELLPETFLLGPDGAVRLRFVGPRDWSDANAVEVLREGLRAPVSSAPASSDD